MRDRHFLLYSAGAVALAVSATPAGSVHGVEPGYGRCGADFRRDLPHHRHRQTAGLLPRPRRGGAARRQPDGRRGVLSLDEAYRAIDFDTIALLLGMMIVVANLRLSGFFRLVTDWVVTGARHPLLLLAAVIADSGCFSAFLVNDTICLVLTPLVARPGRCACAATRCPICWRSRWPPTSAASRRSPAIRRT